MKNLKQKLCMTALLLSIGMNVCAQAKGFKVNGVKYYGYADGTAELWKYKNAEGKVDIPATVTNPKTGKVYTVTVIRDGACSYNKITELTIPNTIKIIYPHAFYDNKFESLVIPGSVERIDKEAFKTFDKGELTTLVIDSASTSTRISLCPDAFKHAPIKTLVINRNIEFSPNWTTPFDFHHTLKQLTIGHRVKSLPLSLLDGCDALELITVLSDSISDGNLTTVFEYLKSRPKVAFGNDTVSIGGVQKYLIERRERERIRQIELAEYNEFVDLIPEYIKAAKEDLKKFNDMQNGVVLSYRHKFPEVWSPAVNFICDSIFLPKKEFNAAEQDAAIGLCNNLFLIIDLDNGYGWNGNPNIWGYNDRLNQDQKKTEHQKIYERILAFAEKILESPDCINRDYAMTLQLVGLCGTDRWKEAEQYFPEVHRIVTGNGRYIVPDAINYMKDCLTQRGYKPIVPKYTNNTTKEPTNADMVKFFLKQGINNYQKNKEKERRERERTEEILRRLQEAEKSKK